MEEEKAELGFWLYPEYWGKGIMSEVITMVVTYGFEQMLLLRIEAFVEFGNVKSGKTLTRLGFKHEKDLKDCEVKGDKRITLEVYSILNKKATP
jgi:ribosomal-protein-alanine N-acetyltransferase